MNRRTTTQNLHKKPASTWVYSSLHSTFKAVMTRFYCLGVIRYQDHIQEYGKSQKWMTMIKQRGHHLISSKNNTSKRSESLPLKYPKKAFIYPTFTTMVFKQYKTIKMHIIGTLFWFSGASLGFRNLHFNKCPRRLFRQSLNTNLRSPAFLECFRKDNFGRFQL